MLVVITIKGTMLPEKVKQFPPGFIPDVVRQVHTAEVEGLKQVAEIVMQLTTGIVGTQGMLVHDDPYHQDLSKPTTARKWFPMHMIAFLSAEVEQIPTQEGILVQ
jgi:hypothetical protein